MGSLGLCRGFHGAGATLLAALSVLFVLASEAYPHTLCGLQSSAARASISITRPLARQLVTVASVYYDSQGEVLRPVDSTQPWDGGCVTVVGAAPPGQVLLNASANAVGSLQGCCEMCRSRLILTTGLRECSMYAYCDAPAGCNDTHGVYTPQGGCQLVWQTLSDPQGGDPPRMEEAPGWIGGAPIKWSSTPVLGYSMYIGRGLHDAFDYPCHGSLYKGAACWLAGLPKDLAAQCDSDPLCLGMDHYPNGLDYSGIPMTVFKGGYGATLNKSAAVLSQNSVLYVSLGKAAPPASASPQPPFASPLPVQPNGSGSGDSSSSSTGLAIGVAVGACAAVVAVLAGFLVWRRTQRRKQLDSLRKVPGGSDSGGVPGGSGSSSLQQAGGSKNVSGGGTSGSDLHDSAGERRVASEGGAYRRAPLEVPPGGSGGRARSFPLSSGGTPPILPLRSGGSNVTAESGSLGSQLGSFADDSLLARLPSDDWQSCVVDPSSLTLCKNPDGSYQKLGSGAFASVYRVLVDGVQPLAAKVLDAAEDDPKLQEAFLREASLLRQLRHRNIVGFAGVCIHEGSCMILMELMDGKDLYHRVDSVNKAGVRVFAWNQRGKVVALDIARAIHYLHSKNMTHFDIKSCNVLLSRDLTAKLADVGFTKAMRATHHSLSEGKTGTFDYMAPELLLGRPCTSAVDIYSFGILLWELVTGEHPLRGCMRKLKPEECPPEVAELVMECIEEDPDKRPTAAEIVKRLSKLK